MTPDQLAEELGTNKAALAQWRHRGCGPRFLKEGHFIRYRRSDVTEWLESRLHTRTDIAAHTGGAR